MPVFTGSVLTELAKKHYPNLRQLVKLEQVLKDRFHKMDDPIRALMLAVASREPLLLIGEPGAAKSLMLDDFCDMLGLTGKQKFKYLLTQFTEPGELFGFYDIARVLAGGENKALVRYEKQNKIQEATVIYLDEVFRASSAILNSLLTLMQEHEFYDRGDAFETPWRCLVGATNYPPESEDLAAMYDRFLLRCEVKVVSATYEEVTPLLAKGWSETYSDPEDRSQGRAASTHAKEFEGLIPALKNFRDDIRNLTRSKQLAPALQSNDAFGSGLIALIEWVRDEKLSRMSNRRIIKLMHVMVIDAVYQAVARANRIENLPAGIDVGMPQLDLIPRFFLDRFGELEDARKQDFIREVMLKRAHA